MVTRKSRVTQSIANGWPDWTRIRTDEQSVGQSFINSVALGLEDLILESQRGYKNLYLTTAFPGEIDQTYKLTLPNYFEFTTQGNQLNQQFNSPEVSGLIDSNWVDITEIHNNSIQDFWYQALPTRLSLEESFPNSNHLVASGLSTDLSLQLIDSGLFLNNRLTVITQTGPLVEVEANNNILRSKVRITGVNWKLNSDTEDVVFLFPESKQTFKPWSSVSRVQCVDFPTETLVHIYSHQFNQQNYLDSFDTVSQFSSSRENLPMFWSLGQTSSGYSTLDLQRYTVDKAIDLLPVTPQFETIRRWELLDNDGDSVLIQDIQPVPFQQKIIGASNNKLYIWDTYQELPNIQVLTQRTPDALITIELDNDYPLREEDIEVNLVFSKPIKTIVRNRLSIQYPDGTEWGILADGSLVSTSSDYYLRDETSNRFIRSTVFITTEDLGQHILTFECQYLDNSIEIAQRAFVVQSKEALVELSFSNITTAASGIDIDHQNQLLILTTSGIIHQINRHYDYCLIDFDNKELLLREDYDQVKVIP